MDFISDLMGIIRKGPEMASQINTLDINNKSIIRGANDATFQFPILITDTIPIDMANTFARTMDRVYASFTQTWISLHPFMDISLDPTPISYLKKLHQNMRMESVEEHEDEGELLDRMISEAYAGENLLYMNPDHTFGIMFSGQNKASSNMIQSHRKRSTAGISLCFSSCAAIDVATAIAFVELFSISSLQFTTAFLSCGACVCFVGSLESEQTTFSGPLPLEYAPTIKRIPRTRRIPPRTECFFFFVSGICSTIGTPQPGHTTALLSISFPQFLQYIQSLFPILRVV